MYWNGRQANPEIDGVTHSKRLLSNDPTRKYKSSVFYTFFQSRFSTIKLAEENMIIEFDNFIRISISLRLRNDELNPRL